MAEQLLLDLERLRYWKRKTDFFVGNIPSSFALGMTVTAVIWAAGFGSGDTGLSCAVADNIVITGGDFGGDATVGSPWASEAGVLHGSGMIGMVSEVASVSRCDAPGSCTVHSVVGGMSELIGVPGPHRREHSCKGGCTGGGVVTGISWGCMESGRAARSRLGPG